MNFKELAMNLDPINPFFIIQEYEKRLKELQEQNKQLQNQLIEEQKKNASLENPDNESNAE